MTPDVIVLPGIPGMPGKEHLEDGRAAYPGETSDIVKLLREQGLNVQYSEARERRATVEHKAAEFWIPVLMFVQAVSTNVAGALLADVILSWLGDRAQDSFLHVKFSVKKGEDVKEFEAHGKGSEVLEAMRKFEKGSS